MKKIYLFPFLFDFVGFLVAMRVADAAGREMGITNLQAALLVIVYSLGYLIACPLSGHFLNRRNARAWLLCGTALALLTSAPLCFTTTFWPTFGLQAVFGIAMALCFNSVQTFLRGEVPPGALGRAIARYTFAWSAGIGCGFLFAGLFKSLGSPWPLALCSALACLLVFILVLTHQPRDLEIESADAIVEVSTGVAAVNPRYVLVGWALCFGANFCQRPLMTFLPKFYAQMHRPAYMAGTLFFIFLLGQAGFGLYSGRLRPLLYRRGALFAVQALVGLFLALLWAFPHYLLSLIAMALLGCAYGFIYFAAVYYVSNDERSSRNVGINEAMVGGGNICGLLVSQWVLGSSGRQDALYPALMLSLVVLMAIQWLWLQGSGATAEVAVPSRAAGSFRAVLLKFLP